MSDSKQGGAFGVLVLIAALVVMGGGGVLLWKLLQEHKEAPRPKTPVRYLQPSDPKLNPPADFNAEKVDENEIIP